MILRCIILLTAYSVGAADLPRLADYTAGLTKIDHYEKAIVPSVKGSSRCIRDLAYDRAAPPDFADRYTLFLTGCGSGCAEFCLIDRITGSVFPGFIFSGGPKVGFVRESNLVIVKHTDGMYGDSNPFYADCYLWEKDHFRFLGRWSTHYGEAQKKSIDWIQVVRIDPNPPTWPSR